MCDTAISLGDQANEKLNSRTFLRNTQAISLLSIGFLKDQEFWALLFLSQDILSQGHAIKKQTLGSDWLWVTYKAHLF